MTDLQTTIAERVTSSVGIALEAVRASIAEQMSATMEQALKKSNEDEEIVRFQLEGRITRTKDNLNGFIMLMRNDHAKFQSQMRSTIASL